MALTRRVPGTVDAVIIGAGPAGLAAAIAASRKGLQCVVIEARNPPIDKPCGEGLLPQGVRALASLGVELSAGAAVPFRGIRFIDRDTSVVAEFPQGPGFALRRVHLHELLISCAAQAGVCFLWNARISEWTPNQVTVGSTRIAYRWLIGADGQHSAVRDRAGIAARQLSSKRFGFRRHFQVVPWTDMVEVYWRDSCQIVMTPTGTREVGVAVISRNPQLRLQQALPLFPALAEKLQGAAPTTVEGGDATALVRVARVTRGNVALVGDASGTVDALTGHGMSLAFHQALELAEALGREDLNYYQAAHRKAASTPSMMTRLMLAMAEHDRLRHGALAWLSRSPQLFSRLLEVHTGAASFSSAARQELARRWSGGL